MGDNEQSTGKNRATIIGAINSPLGFYVLALLISEGFLLGAALFSDLEKTSKMTCVWLGFWMFLVVVVVVTGLVIGWPKNLTYDKEFHHREHGVEITPGGATSAAIAEAEAAVKAVWEAGNTEELPIVK